MITKEELLEKIKESFFRALTADFTISLEDIGTKKRELFVNMTLGAKSLNKNFTACSFIGEDVLNSETRKVDGVTQDEYISLCVNGLVDDVVDRINGNELTARALDIAMRDLPEDYRLLIRSHHRLGYLIGIDAPQVIINYQRKQLKDRIKKLDKHLVITYRKPAIIDS